MDLSLSQANQKEWSSILRDTYENVKFQMNLEAPVLVYENTHNLFLTQKVLCERSAYNYLIMNSD